MDDPQRQPLCEPVELVAKTEASGVVAGVDERHRRAVRLIVHTPAAR